MISKTMQDALNKQINMELYSSYLYLSMAAYFEDLSLAGFSNWMRCQVKEEDFHVMKMYDYLAERGGRILLASIDAPPTEWESPLECFRAVYQHEQSVTGRINDLVKLAREEGDYATDSFLQWFVDEQVEEEQASDDIIKKLTLMGDFKGGLFMMDQELAQRVFTPPVPPA